MFVSCHLKFAVGTFRDSDLFFVKIITHETRNPAMKSIYSRYHILDGEISI